MREEIFALKILVWILEQNFLLYSRTGSKPTEENAISFSLAESGQSADAIFKSANFSVALDPIL